ncbi:hypothetical protein BS47DRAFT_1399401 [Hydnum rufescens UP504]|uniref:Uncharacterized protein n=1 Tax=Hydnum rufescens UP504 TaxID=1448309 RepID=A0A9P6AIM8_9AGAM|nr:hypothetical protein BS47DRAFT_1399401 [Hydnum rufescens UP504]
MLIHGGVHRQVVALVNILVLQGLTGAGIFTLGHDAGHGSLSDHQFVNHTIGFIAHTFILAHISLGDTPPPSSSMERDENYLPKTRSELKMAPESVMKKADYEEIFGETPFYTLTRMAIMQFLGWQLYLTINALGSTAYPPGTNHWNPSSALFRKSDRIPIIITNTALCLWATCLAVWTYNTSLLTFIKFYLVPYVLLNHWVLDFPPGAVTTIDRPLMGWMGRFFFHNISHDHIAHHFYSSAPFYNGPEITKYVRKALGDEYNYDSTNTFRALYRSFTNCEFVEDDGGIVMWKNREGKAVRKVAGEVDKME